MTELEQEQTTPVRQDTNTFVILGFVFGGLSFICCCCSPIFAIPAIILGAVAYSRGDRRGLWVIILGVAGLVLGSGAGFFWGYYSKPYYHWMPSPDHWKRV
jgi:membrane protein DedA with SNARE-associated domain